MTNEQIIAELRKITIINRGDIDRFTVELINDLIAKIKG